MANQSLLHTPEPQRYDGAVPAALVIADSEARALEATHALAQAGCRVRRQLRFAEAAREIGHYDGLDLLLIEAEAAPDALLDVVLGGADAVARERGLGVIATVAPGQIDAAAALLLRPGTQLLCDPTETDRVSAIAWLKWRARGRLHDATRDAESVRLQRLNEEVARIADTLARLTRGEDMAGRFGVRAPVNGYRGPDDAPVPEVSAQEVRAVIRARRLRSQFFAPELFADPAWDMLLDLFAADLERRQVSVSSLCIAAAVPPTTALRWIGTMHDAGLFERKADPTDRRRAYIALSDKGLDGMRSYAGALKRAGLALV